MLNDTEIESLENIASTLKPVMIGVTKLCKQNCTLIDADKIIQFILENVKADANVYARIFRSNFEKRIESRRNKEVSSLLTYIMKEPKQYLLEYCSNEEIIDFALKLMRDLNLDCDEPDNAGEICNIDENDMESILDSRLKSKKTKHEMADLEIILKFIEKNEINDKRIEQLIKALQSFQPTSVNPERCFSLSGWFQCKRRNRISPELLDSLIFLKENIKKYVKKV